MRPLVPTATLLLALLLPATSVGEDAVEIKLAEPKAGDRFKVTKTERSKTTATSGRDMDGEDEVESAQVSFVEEVVTPGRAGGKPLELVRTYTKYERESKTKAAEAVPPIGVPITIARKDGKYGFTAGDKPLGTFVRILDSEFNKITTPITRDLLPNKPVKPGETWKIDRPLFIHFGTDTAKGSVTGKLVKVYQKDGKPIGVLEVRAEYPLKSSKDIMTHGFTRTVIGVEFAIDGSDPSVRRTGTVEFESVSESKDVYVAFKARYEFTDNGVLLPKK